MGFLTGIGAWPNTGSSAADGPVDLRREIKEAVEDAFDGGIPAPEKFSTEEPDAYNYSRYFAKDNWGVDRVSDISYRTNWAAEKFKSEFGRWPRGDELVKYDPYYDTVRLWTSGAWKLPGTFGFLDQETGDERWILNTGVEWSEPDRMLGTIGLTAGRAINEAKPDLPFYDDLGAILAEMAPLQQPSGSGSRSGGGGGGRAAVAFDKNKLGEDVTNRWRGMLLEEPDDATVNQTVADYIAAANGFWLKEAGSLDFDTFVVDRIRAQSKYKTLYGRKPEFQSEAEYMAGYRQAAGQVGMNQSATLREIEAGARSGVGLAGFSERVGRTREARNANVGGFSQQLAQTFKSMPGLAGS